MIHSAHQSQFGDRKNNALQDRWRAGAGRRRQDGMRDGAERAAHRRACRGAVRNSATRSRTGRGPAGCGQRAIVHGNLALKALPEISAWTAAIAEAAYAASAGRHADLPRRRPCDLGRHRVRPRPPRGRDRAAAVRAVARRASGFPHARHHRQRQSARRAARLCQRPAGFRRLFPGSARRRSIPRVSAPWACAASIRPSAGRSTKRA